MKVAVCQTNPVLFDVKSNLDDIIQKIYDCRENGADLIVFPELALTGYFVGSRYHEAALRLDSPEIMQLAAATTGTAAIIGFIEESRSMNFYNSALIAVNGEIVFANRKLNLPNYGVFEERKFFSCGKRIRTFRYQGFNIAVFICNDVWHPSLPYLGACQKADIFVTCLNSSSETMGSEFSNIETWQIINTFYSRVFGIYNIAANRVGRERPEDEFYQGNTGINEDNEPDPANAPKSIKFWGGSEIVNPFGNTIAKGALYEPDVIYADISRELLRQKKILLPYLRNDDPYFTHRELQKILYGKEGSEAPPGK